MEKGMEGSKIASQWRGSAVEGMLLCIYTIEQEGMNINKFTKGGKNV